MAIQISDKIITQVIKHAETSYPHECCGFIIGTASIDQSGDIQASGSYYLPCLNEKNENRERRFLIDPLAYQDAEDKADSEGLSIISIVHSHPDHPDIPSEFDRVHAWPGLSYIIVSVCNGTASGYRSWRLTDDRERFDQELVRIDNGS
ncbi:Mov34/MPN/PAD-1 family protein [Photobacterium kasasachensis]|uniref:Mov34/MPN/PAD-1 family protein n=1 Tax=Photobacterium kasasachensis TaxID=2910240 RepID=UPI003D100310